MGKVVAFTSVTLDGVMQSPGRPDEDTRDGFQHGGWGVPYADADQGRIAAEGMASVGGILLGRRTYEDFYGYWPKQTDGNPFTEVLNNTQKYVASTTLTTLDWQNSKLIEPNVVDGIHALKAEDGPELQVHGSANLIQTLLEHGLVDAFRLKIFPLVLGTGKRLFGDGTAPAGFEVVSSRVLSSGVIVADYRTGVEIKYGSFA
jgi:dihydrofolate reductase